MIRSRARIQTPIAPKRCRRLPDSPPELLSKVPQELRRPGAWEKRRAYRRCAHTPPARAAIFLKVEAGPNRLRLPSLLSRPAFGQTLAAKSSRRAATARPADIQDRAARSTNDRVALTARFSARRRNRGECHPH